MSSKVVALRLFFLSDTNIVAGFTMTPHLLVNLAEGGAVQKDKHQGYIVMELLSLDIVFLPTLSGQFFNTIKSST